MKERTTPVFIHHLDLDEIFVFGSNIAGRHGKGAALIARQKWGAFPGHGEGHYGRTYAIPFKDGRPSVDPQVKKVLPLDEVRVYVDRFIECARQKPSFTFLVVEVGCGNAHYTPEQVAPLFAKAAAVENIHLPASFWKVLNK